MKELYRLKTEPRRALEAHNGGMEVQNGAMKAQNRAVEGKVKRRIRIYRKV
jgi:hypothetical protein